MKNLIAIIAGEPNSINSEIISKAWKIKKNKLRNLFIIGNYSLLTKQISKLGISIPIIKINKNPMTNIPQQIFTITENNENAIVTVETLRGKIVTGKIIMLDYRSFGIENESGERDLFLMSQIKSVTEISNN